ncbi:MAG: hypothetical protein R3A13_04365 [Bdellovibrionota bacterium]
MNNPNHETSIFPINKLIFAGWFSLLTSSILLGISIYIVKITDGDIVTYVLWITFARIFGIGSFIIGVICIAAGRWNHGTLMILGSIGLPILSLYIHHKL